MLYLTKLTQELYNKLYQDITEFRTTFGLPVNVSLHTEEDDKLHTSLIVEEMTELAQADSKVEQADAIVDSVYVLMGRLVHAYTCTDKVDESFMHAVSVTSQIEVLLHVADNLGIDFLSCWDVIHASNMSKACNNEAEFEDTRAHYATLGIKVVSEEVNGKLVVKCAEDFVSDEKTVLKGKVLKSVFYTPANLEPLM